MKSKLALCFIAAFGFVVANVSAQDSVDVAAPAPAVVASQTTVQPLGDCDECAQGGFVGFGRFGGLGSPRAYWEQRDAERRDEIGRRRQIVQRSPYAYPTGELQDWARFRNYPYVYYDHNFGTRDMRIPGYNPAWQNYYPSGRRYHQGNHFNLDVF